MPDSPIAIVEPDTRFRFSLAKLIPKVARYEVFRTDRGGVRIEPLLPVPDQSPTQNGVTR